MAAIHVLSSRLSFVCLVSTMILIIYLISGVEATNNVVLWYRTAKENQDRLSQQANLTFSTNHTTNYKFETIDYTITVNRSLTYQTIIGFGGAFTDSASHIFSKLNSTLQSTVLNKYFSPDGLRYNMARLPIGSCDFSLHHYTYDEEKDDVELTHFSIEHDRAEIIPFIKRALAELAQNESLYIVASPWSPPGWMKVEESPYCPTSCLECRLKDKYEVVWANYFVKFISSYAQEGIKIWGVTVQNEPGACPMEYEGMHFNPETQRDFIKYHLGPALNDSDVKILIYDHNKNYVVKWAETIYSDKEASSYVWGTAVHWYSGDDFGNLNITHGLFPDKPILATEATVEREKNPAEPKWEHGEHYAHDIIGDMNNWVVGFIDWNLLLDHYGGPDHAGPKECEGLIKCGSDAMMLVDVDKQILYLQIFYYYVGHFSKFVPRGSLRIHSKVSVPSEVGSNKKDAGLECVAFLTPQGNVSLIVMNTGDSSVTFKLNDVLNDGTLQGLEVVALAHSIQTFLYN